MTENISILGSTGSIGTQTLDVVREIGGIKVWAMSTNTRIELFEKQVREFKPEVVCVMDKNKALEFKKNISDLRVEVLSGMEGLIAVATYDKADTVVNSVVGNIGLVPTVKAICSGKNIALANKETLVTSGKLVMNLLKENNVSMYPVDSEHSAIFQCLQGNKDNKIKKILLTASGGPFRTFDDVSKVTVDDALKHPNWSMGKKITIDSATLMNKGLEVIEAKWLFGVDLDQIQVVVHPQSIVHSMVEYEDGAVIAQLGVPDMRLPIQYAFSFPQRLHLNGDRLDLFKTQNLQFFKPDYQKFKCLQLAFDAIRKGGNMSCIVNAANEIVNAGFRKGECGFLQMADIIEETMAKATFDSNPDLDVYLQTDAEARRIATELMHK